MNYLSYDLSGHAIFFIVTTTIIIIIVTRFEIRTSYKLSKPPTYRPTHVGIM